MAVTSADAHRIAATRQDLEQVDDRAWQLYGDLCRTPDATDKERQRAFDAAMSSTNMLMDLEAAQRS